MASHLLERSNEPTLVYRVFEPRDAKRGDEGRTPDTYEADLHFGYPIEIGPASPSSASG